MTCKLAEVSDVLNRFDDLFVVVFVAVLPTAREVDSRLDGGRNKEKVWEEDSLLLECKWKAT